MDSDSVIRTARPEVLRVLLYADLAVHRVTASVSIVIARKGFNRRVQPYKGLRDWGRARGWTRSHFRGKGEDC